MTSTVLDELQHELEKSIQAGLIKTDSAPLAQQYLEQALASNVKTFGDAHPDVAIKRNNLGGVWDAKGEYDKAIAYFEQAYKTVYTMLGEKHPDTQLYKANLESAQAARDAAN